MRSFILRMGVLVALLLLSLDLQASTPKRVLSFHQWVTEMKEARSEIYLLENAEIRYNPQTDGVYLSHQYDADSCTINALVVLRHVNFQAPPKSAVEHITNSYLLKGVRFKQNLELTSVTGAFPVLENVEVKGFVIFHRCDMANLELRNVICGGMNLYKNRIHARAIVEGVQFTERWFWIYRNKMRSLVLIDNTFDCRVIIEENQYSEYDDDLFVENNREKGYRSRPGIFEMHGNSFNANLTFSYNDFRSLPFADNEVSGKFLLHMNTVSSDVEISLNKFHGPININGHQGNKFTCLSNVMDHQSDSLGFLLYGLDLQSEFVFYGNEIRDSTGRIGFHFEKIQCKFLNVQKNKFLGPTLFYACFVNGRMVLSRNEFQKPVGFSSLKYDDQSFIEWENLRHKLSTFELFDFRKQFPFDSIEYLADSDSALEQTRNFNRLVQIYSDLKNLYRIQGNLSDANELEVLVGDLRLKRFEYLYRKEADLKSFFNWKMNAFMKEFSAYGTDPVISIIYSLRIILFFALFYLFFHNRWNKETRGQLGKRLKLLLNYFRSSEDLVVHYEKEMKERNEKDRELARAYERSANKVPPFFLRLTEFYFNYLNLKPRARRALLKRLEFMSGSWINLPAKRKFWVAHSLSVWFGLYLLWYVASNILNAIALSVNAFTTLGFGYIPTEGISRYVLILEGFLGWVMMSIFSVTLISQLIG